MSPDTWSWIAATASVVGLWVSGQNPRHGWTYGIACQGLWVAYGFATDQRGMIALSFAFVAIYLRNLHRWRRTDFRTVSNAATRQADHVMPERLAS